MRIELPQLCVVAMVGVSGSGKSTFAKTYFKSTEVLSSDYFRGLVSDDENDQTASQAAFESLHYIAAKRLEAGRLTVIDATNVQSSARKDIIELARNHNCLAVAIVLNMPEQVCNDRNKKRTDRQFGGHVVKRQNSNLKRSIKYLRKEGFRYVFVINSPEEVEEVEIVRVKLWNDKSHEHGPFDIIGDVHGCFDELCELLEKLGYEVDVHQFTAKHPEGRKAVFLGDLIDRGPKIIEVLKLTMNMVKDGDALCVTGNHEAKLLKKLKGANVQATHGLEDTMNQMEFISEELKEEIKIYLDSMIGHYVLDDGKLVVAHAGMKAEYQGRSSARVRNFAIYGETTGETDHYGLPVRMDWASEYRGLSKVIYGHTPQAEVYEINNTINIDTGCVFGGKLTAYSYPENKFSSIPAYKTYYEPSKPLVETYEYTDILNIDDVLGRRYITTRLQPAITIQEGNSIAALEIMSRFAADPHWLIYLPPTMSPCETSKIEDVLEHPIEAFEYFRSKGIEKVVCEQKHMGSRAVMIVCKDLETTQKRFFIKDGNAGIIYTRTGRHFFGDRQFEGEMIQIVRQALTDSNFWEEFSTDWVCLDTELMPWSAKAQTLLEQQYAPTGCAGRIGLNVAIEALKNAVEITSKGDSVDGAISGQSIDLTEIVTQYEEKEAALNQYTDAYRQYCWSVGGMEDYKIAPFHILATEGVTYSDKSNVWHMDKIKEYMTRNNSMMIATPYMVVDVNDEESVKDGIDWWSDLTESGGEGMVVKPYSFIGQRENELLQPAVKCRGKEYLRIIYGPEYTLRNNLRRLKKRSLSKKRSLALREFALGMESLERFVKNEPLHRVHECVFGVLALESEPVDPRL